MDIDFHIDEVTRTRIAGWAWLPADPEVALIVELSDRAGTRIAATIATEYRRDLTAAGKRGGWCAFAILLSDAEALGAHRLNARFDERTFTLVHPVSFEAEPSF